MRIDPDELRQPSLIGLCGWAGPLLGAAGKGAVPVVVGELLAGAAAEQSVKPRRG